MKYLKELNDDQLDGLSSLCLDLAKLSFGFALVPSTQSDLSKLQIAMLAITSILWGIVFVIISMVLLRQKSKYQK
jgi:hypothetical protein